MAPPRLQLLSCSCLRCMQLALRSQHADTGHMHTTRRRLGSATCHATLCSRSHISLNTATEGLKGKPILAGRDAGLCQLVTLCRPMLWLSMTTWQPLSRSFTP